MAQELVNLFDYEDIAKERLPRANFDLIAGGATDEITLRRNRTAYQGIMLRPRMLVDVGQVDTSTMVLGHKISLPVMVAPASSHNQAHPDAELATARAAGREGTIMGVSSAASCTLEEIAQEATGTLWFQQYFYKDRELTMTMAQRAKDAGYKALYVTVDSKVNPKRERDIRNNRPSSVPPNYASMNLEKYYNEHSRYSPIGLHFIRDNSATWEYVDWFLANSPLPVVVKGIMTGEEGRLCVEHGVKALVVSNHGGGVLDGTFGSVEVLPEVVEAVEGRCEVYVDGGIRRGADVVKALALGARAVLIGRPIFWGLAANGEEGVRQIFKILLDELRMTMAMCGRPTVESIDRSLVGTTSPLLEALGTPGP
jgi:4-hydroxymandelate oxidase